MNIPDKVIAMDNPRRLLPWWLTQEIPPQHPDFSQRIVSLPQFAHWRATQIDGLELRILEYIPGERTRLTGQLRLNSADSPAPLGDSPDLEILIQRGELECPTGVYPAGLYLRLPSTDNQFLQSLSIRCTEPMTQLALNLNAPQGSSMMNPEDALLYIAVDQMMSSDTEQRRLNTYNESRWLPGPIDGIEVLPLHGHGSGNVMLLRWNKAVSFKPRLDPMGEEILVLEGTLNDVHGYYSAGSWIRNPIAAWQSWGGVAGTVVYYKNGHLPALNPDP